MQRVTTVKMRSGFEFCSRIPESPSAVGVSACIAGSDIRHVPNHIYPTPAPSVLRIYQSIQLRYFLLIRSYYYKNSEVVEIRGVSALSRQTPLLKFKLRFLDYTYPRVKTKTTIFAPSNCHGLPRSISMEGTSLDGRRGSFSVHFR